MDTPLDAAKTKWLKDFLEEQLPSVAELTSETPRWQAIATDFTKALNETLIERKVSGGSRSMERFKQTANLLTAVVQTCRRQARSVIEFFEQSLMAKAGHDNFSVPTLIPLY